MKRLLPLLPLLALAACETVGPPPPRLRAEAPPPSVRAPAFDARDFAWSTETGPNGLTGRVTYRSKTSAYTCAGGSVGLTPATELSARRTERLYGSTEHAVESVETVRARSAGETAPAYADYVRSAKCDAEGRFTFNALPQGVWFLIARAKPLHGVGEDVVIMRRVATGGGAVTTLALH